MAAGFKVATVNASDVPATLTNYPAYVDLSRLGITTLAEAQSVRVYADSAKTTEWAREIVTATEMHVKIPSLTSSTVIYVDWDGVRSDYTTTDTYGRNAVWSDYVAVYHLESASTDSKGSYDGTDTSISYSSSQIGNGASMNANTDRISLGSNTAFQYGEGDSFTIQAWASSSNRDFGRFLFGRQDGAGTADFRGYSLFMENTSGQMKWDMYSDLGSGGNNQRRWASVFGATNTPYMLHLVSTGTSNAAGINLYSNGALQSATTVNDTLTGSTAVTRYANIGNRYGSNLGWLGWVDEVRWRTSSLSADWITTEYNNQSDESGFWGTWTDAGGGATPTPTLMMMGVGS